MSDQTPEEPLQNIPIEDEVEEDEVIGQLNTILSNEWYDRLKFLALVLLPALGAAYFGFAEIWGLPFASEVVGSIVVIDTFLGALLAKAGTTYKSETEGPTVGIMEVSYDETGKKLFSLGFPGDPYSIDPLTHDKVTFKVRPADPS